MNPANSIVPVSSPESPKARLPKKRVTARKPSPRKPLTQADKNELKQTQPIKQAGGKKEKLVRDSFTFPESEYKLLSQVKKKLVASGVEVKKVELVRVGLAFVAGASNSDLEKRLKQLPKLKTGRPKKKSSRKSAG